jgi:hypothetical protein
MEPRRSSRPFEYFLDAAIISETALAALIYKIILHTGALVRLRVCFAVFYVAFVAWAIVQIARLRRNRESETLAATPAGPGDKRRVLGLTGSQLVVVMMVFAIAVATFSWALRRLR